MRRLFLVLAGLVLADALLTILLDSMAGAGLCGFELNPLFRAGAGDYTADPLKVVVGRGLAALLCIASSRLSDTLPRGLQRAVRAALLFAITLNALAVLNNALQALLVMLL